jgi:hypothetical protein
MGSEHTVKVDIQTVATMYAVDERNFKPHGGCLFCGIALDARPTLMTAN